VGEGKSDYKDCFRSQKHRYHIPEIKYPSDDKRDHYFGQVNSGTPSGEGTMTWKDGQLYKGI
jgi:hypothetical protein